jgi:UDP-N-acetylglucosamine 2-epimerase (non-hydrolysing)
VFAALKGFNVPQLLVHTGQHYDDNMSDAFFRELDLPRPDVNLAVGSGTHGRQTAGIMIGIEDILLEARPRLVIVYGDVNSTIAAAMVAAKLHIPIAHVEAGLRSFDRKMPEEINRILTDQISDLLFTTSPEAIDNLTLEGVSPERVHFVGNTMIDTLAKVFDSLDPAGVRLRLGLPDDYLLATLHRPSNVDELNAAREVVRILRGASERLPVVIPLHPRGRSQLQAAGLTTGDKVVVLEPQTYLDFMSAVQGSRAVITDSGGVQEETTFLGVPCLTLRTTTERPITITHGTNRLVSPETVLSELDVVLSQTDGNRNRTVPPLWDGHAGSRIAEIVKECASRLAD